MSKISLPVCIWIPLIFILVNSIILRRWGVWWILIPNLESICPTEIFEFPPAITWGLIRMHTGILGCFAPNCSKMDKLSILMRTPRAAASSISSKETPLGVKMIDSGEKPAKNPNRTSWMDTVSKPLPRLFISRRMAMLDKAFAA